MFYTPDTDEEWECYRATTPKCPYCNYEDPDYWEWAYNLPPGDDEEKIWETITCGECEKDFNIAYVIEHCWTTKRKEEKND